MKALSQFRRGFLVLSAVGVPLAGGGLLLASDPLFQSGLRKYGPMALGQPVEFQDAGISAFLGSARIQGLVIGPPQQPLVQAGHIGFSAAPLNFIRGRIRIDEAALDDTTLHLVVDENGHFSFDPGLPPPQTPPSGRKPRQKPLPPEKDRDIVQVVAEYWDRIQQYKEYYDRIHALQGGKESEEEEERRHGGRASYLRAHDPPGSGFWLGEVGLENFQLDTRDERTGQPIVPALRSVTLKIENFGDAPAGFTGPAVIRAAGEFAGGGALGFLLQLGRDGSGNALRFRAEGLPAADWIHLAAQSLPWDVPGGTVDIVADELRFTDDSLSGDVHLVLRGMKLRARPGAPDVLGVSAADFTRVLNSGLEQGPIEIVLGLSGSPTEPKFAVKNGTSPADLILNGLRKEAEDRLRGELAEQGQKRLDDWLGERAPDLGGLLGGDSSKPPDQKEKKGKGKDKDGQPPH